MILEQNEFMLILFVLWQLTHRLYFLRFKDETVPSYPSHPVFFLGMKYYQINLHFYHMIFPQSPTLLTLCVCVCVHAQTLKMKENFNKLQYFGNLQLYYPHVTAFTIITFIKVVKDGRLFLNRSLSYQPVILL